MHQIRYWDNGHPYDGRVPGWGHRLMGDGHRVTSIGKLHYRDSNDPNGFDEELLPMHVLNGIGDTVGLVRRPPPPRPNARLLAEEAGRGESTYTEYDRAITAESCRWLAEQAPTYADKPWVLFVSLVCPHFPLRAPEEFFDLYPPDAMPWPIQRDAEARPKHPVLEALRGIQNYDDFFRDDDHRRTAIAAYYGMVSFLDDNIGKVLKALETEQLRRHHAGDLYQRSRRQSRRAHQLGQGADVRGERGRAANHGRSRHPGGSDGLCPRPRWLIFIPTAIAAVGGELTPEERDALPGHSLFDVAAGYRTRADSAGGISRRRLDHRLLHDPSGQMEICPLHRLRAAAFRSGV